MNNFDDESIKIRTNGYKIKYKYEEYGNSYVIRFYKDQLEKFKMLGLGNDTEYGVEITRKLINRTEKRLDELRPKTLKRKDEEWQM